MESANLNTTLPGDQKGLIDLQEMTPSSQMRLKSFALLTIVVLSCTLAGCVSNPLGEGTTTSPSVSVTCDDAINDSTEHVEDVVSAVDSAETAVALSTTIERRIADRRKTGNVSVHVLDERVEIVSDGYIVTFPIVSVTTRRGTAIGDDGWSAQYRITDDRIQRVEGGYDNEAFSNPRYRDVCP